MSWDNVSDIKNIKIWTDYNDSTQGHLFVNDNHQLKLNVGISFTLNSGTTEGPTENEVKSALSLINNQDSGPLKYLSVVEEGSYTAVYDPYHVSTSPSDDTSNTGDGVYDFIFTYYVTSPSSINAETYAESVALKLVYPYTDAKGDTTEVVKETSAKGNYYTKTYVSVSCYPSMLYGSSNQNRIAIKIKKTEIDADDYKHTVQYDDYSIIHFFNMPIYLDDSYFKIYKFDGGTDTVSVQPYRPIYIGIISDGAMWDYVYNTYFPNINVGEIEYVIDVDIRSNPDYENYEPIVTERVTVKQNENEIMFIFGYIDAKTTNKNDEINNHQDLRIYDQFGNTSNVIVSYNNDGPYIKSVS